MIMKKTFIFLAAVAGLILPVQSQEIDHPDSLYEQLNQLTTVEYATELELSLQDAVQYALRQNRSLQNASLDVKKAHAKRWQSIAAMLPQVNGTAQYTNMCGYEMSLNGMPVAMPPYIQHSVNATIGLSATGIVNALLSNIAIEMQDITRSKSEDDLAANVVSSYAAALVLKDMISLSDSSLANMESIAEQTKRMVEVGAAESTQYDQLAVKVNMLKNTIHQAERNLRISYDALRVLLDVDNTTDLRLTNSLDEILNLEEAYGLLLEPFNIQNNYDYQLLQKKVELAKKTVLMAAMAYVPSVGASYIYTAKKFLSDKAGFNMQPPHTVAVSVNIPLWTSGKNAAAITEQKIALMEAENTLSEVSDNLGIQYQQLRYNLVNTYETYINEKENITVTQRVLKNIGQKYNWGASSALELTNASNDLVSAQTNYVQSVLNLVKAQVDLEKFLNNKPIR